MNVVCAVCSGTDYTLENGFYFCNECHTQTQELREEVFELDRSTNFSRLDKRTIKKKQANTDNKEKITSWECYNYILIGLVDEMINLGTSPELKLIVLQIWTAYLSKIEIAFTSKHNQTLPKFSAVYKHNDAAIIYNKKKPKKRRRTSISDLSLLSENLSASDMLINQKRKTRRKRRYLKAEFEAMNQSDSETNSLQNQSLSSLESSSNTSASNFVTKIKLNHAAHRECLKHLTQEHLNNHLSDMLNELSCHKFTTSRFSTDYINGPYHLSKLKIFSILYLGVLLNNEEIQLGDMIRFCREGHLNYVSYDHFLPSYVLMNIDYKNIFRGGQPSIPNHYEVRRCAARIARLIGIKFVDKPDLLKLCERYIKELALPRQLMYLISDIFIKCPPKMNFFKSKYDLIPNFEGRAMAYIIFAVKVLFGLNGFSENIISEAAEQLNKIQILNDDQYAIEANNILSSECSLIKDNENYSYKYFFVWSDWVKYIECRKCIIQSKHYPTSFLLNSENCFRTKEFINFLNKHKNKLDTEERDRNNIYNQLFKTVFHKISSKNPISTDYSQDFQPTLTPFYSYLNDIIENTGTQSIPELILKNNFTGSDINFLIKVSPVINYINLKELKKIDKVKKETVKMFYYDIKSEGHKIMKLNQLVHIKFDSETLLDFNIESDNSTLDTDEIVLDSLNFDNDNNYEFKCNQHVNEQSEVFRNKHISEDNSDTSIKEILKQRPCENSTDSDIIEINSSSESFQCYQSNEKKTHRNNKTKLNTVNTSVKNLLTFPQNNYWLYHGNTNKITYEMYEKIENRLPNSFVWLLNNCSKTIDMSAKDLYCELICIEVYLGCVKKPAQLFFAEELTHKNIEALYKLIAICKQNW